MGVATNTRALRILAYFTHDMRYGGVVGGAERRFLEISKILREKNVRVSTIEFFPSLSKAWYGVGNSTIETSRVQRYNRVINLILELRLLIMQGVQVARKERIDLIYVTRHDIPEDLIPGYVVSRIVRRPVVVVFHHLLPGDHLSLGHLIEERRKKGYNFMSIVISTIIDAISRKILRGVELSIAVSNSTRRDAESCFGTRNMVVVGNGTNRRKIDADGKIFEAAFCGRIEESKGISILISAWKTVQSRLPGSKLVLVGGNVPEKLQSFQALIDSMNLTMSVKMTGFVSEDEKDDLIRKSKVFVLPSAREGFGLAPLEAMSLGVPCILSDLPALREVYDGVALFVPYGESGVLADAIVELLQDEGKRIELSKKSVLLASGFAWEKVAENELNVLRHLFYNSYGGPKGPQEISQS
jgi:glycosyltransferase involved in cell wall biosynthesis